MSAVRGQLTAIALTVLLVSALASCGRNNSTVSPRSRGDAVWQQCFQRNVVMAHQHKETELIFLGDSITQLMEGVHDLLEKNWGKYDPVELGIGGDFTQHLLWRLQHGEVDGLQPKVAVVLIGTNNLYSNTDEEIFHGIEAVVKDLRGRLPATKILVLGLLPRGHEPNNPFRSRIAGVNALLANGIANGANVFYLDIEKDMLQSDGVLSAEIMPDALHPSRKGYEVMFKAIKPTVDKLLGS